MQCANCRFENMPGSRRCARCDSAIDLGGIAVDVHPPRARRWSKSLQKMLGLEYRLHRRVDRARQGWRQWRSRAAIQPDWTFGFCARLLIPGLAQFAMHRPLRGRIFMGVALAAGLVVLALCGTLAGTIALGVMFSMHAASISDALTTRPRTLAGAIGLGMAVYCALGLLLYLPAGRLIQRAVRVYAVNQNFSPYRQGDVLALYRLGTPKPGHIVIYDRPETTFGLGGEREQKRHIGWPGVDRD